MSYAAEALVNAPPPKPAAAKTAPAAQAGRAEAPSFGDHLAQERQDPAASVSPAATGEPTDVSETAPAQTPNEDLSPEQSPEAPPIQPPAPAPLASPVLVQLIAHDGLSHDNASAPQAAAPLTDPSPDPATENAPPQSNSPVAEAPPSPEAKPQASASLPQTGMGAQIDEAEAAPSAPTQPLHATLINIAPPQSTAPLTPAPQPMNAKAHIKASTSADVAPLFSDGQTSPLATPTPGPSAANKTPSSAAADSPADPPPEDALRGDASVQEKFEAALQKSAARGETGRSEANLKLDRTPATNAQPAFAELSPALASSASPESMSPTAPLNALSAATTHAAAQTQAMNADHVSRAAPAPTQVAQEIIRRFNGASTKFELRLDPPELGRVEVRLEMTRDHKVTAVVAADNPQALTELARHARELEQSLQSAGLELTDNGLSFDLRQSREESQDANSESGREGRSHSEDETLEPTAPLARPIGLERWRGVRVDVMA